MSDAEAFAKIETTRLSDLIASQLRRQIVLGVYPPGSRLPTAQALAALFGVTRLTVREALAQTEAAGLTRTRHGSGTFVVDSSTHATLQTIAEALLGGRSLSDRELRDLLGFRRVIIFGFLDELVKHKNAAQIARLHAIVAEARAHLGDVEKLAALDYDFNEALAEASRNVFYLLLLRSLRRAHTHFGEIAFRQCGDGSVIIDTHAAIARALDKDDASAVRRRVAVYVDGGNRMISKWLATSPSRRAKRKDR